MRKLNKPATQWPEAKGRDSIGKSPRGVMKLMLMLISLAVLGGLACGCSDDEGEYIPSYITNLAVASTNGDSLVCKVDIDDGTSYTFPKPYIKAGAPDSTYRCMATYTKSDGGYTFYALNHVFSANPLPAEKFKAIVHDPVKLQSIWQSKGYINMAVGILTTGQGAHSCGFCIDSIVGDTEYVSLLHEQPKNDAQSYTSKTYISMPFKPTASQMVFSVFTYEGWKQFVFSKSDSSSKPYL